MKARILSLLLASYMVISLALFTTGCSLNISTVANEPKSTPALREASDTRNKIVVISDIPSGLMINILKLWKTEHC